ncbi:hypothetical protein H6F44_20020 [Pseudanabaena sp. FACHB-1277]|jgi:hypothetical protein|uniref:Uncharacterized protein n=1 Tax=Pseudanabaena cinerea FACHB-1277 TaxID=2949581 RepID=A0A926UWC8_9CYAN|nr:hypothetical protein [Pseudanabaena cinerea]MBD2152385.1 hypothetical protein [Pseudanabaena cinerea FACHB-1277]
MTQTDLPVKRLSLIVPQDVAEEICDQPTPAKAMLLAQLGEEVLERFEAYPYLLLSATTTQWLKALTLRQTLQFIENLSLMLMSELNG